MKAVVVGCGWMGQAIAYAMQKLDNEVIVFEPDAAALEAYKARWGELQLKPHRTSLANFPSIVQTEACHGRAIKDFDIVISAAPFRANEIIAKVCIDHEMRYCDLGGNPQVSQEIQRYALEKATLPVFTDLGLAPGYLNMLAEKIARKNPGLTAIYLFCGGLPQMKGNRLNYNLVFSPYGLINEYAGKCRVLREGEIIEVDALTGLEQLGMEHEAFHTKGGIGSTLDSMKAQGVEHCQYKTIRYTGHNDYMRFLMDDCGLSGLSYESASQLKKMLESACPPTKQDLIHMVIRYTTSDGLSAQVVTTIKANEKWTAMQMATSFPTAAVAHLMAQGKLDDQVVPTYADIDIDACQRLLYCINSHVGEDIPWKLEPGSLS